MPYSTITWGNLKTTTLNRLGGAGFYTDTEVGLYLAEALRVWNLLTATWNSEAELNSVQNQIFYKTTLLVDSSNEGAVTDRNILNEIQYHTLETPNNGASISSGIWSTAEFIDALNYRLALFVAETKIHLARNTFASTIGRTRYDLGASINNRVLNIHRAAWVETSGREYGMTPVSRHSYDMLAPTHGTGLVVSESHTPDAYVSASTEVTHSFFSIPPAPKAGTYDIIHTELQSSALSNSGVKVKLPDMFSPYIKWGAIADLLRKDGEANDPTRAEYAEARFREGILLARYMAKDNFNTRVWFGNWALPRTSLYSLDFGNPGWQDDTFSPIAADSGGMFEWFPVGATQIGLHPADSVGGYPIVVEGLTNPTIPSSDGTSVDLDQANLERIIDYAQHIARFKQGGQEFASSMGLFENFLKTARSEEMQRDLKGLHDDALGRDLDEDLVPVHKELQEAPQQQQ
jgi:hypothetical protein